MWRILHDPDQLDNQKIQPEQLMAETENSSLS